MWNWSVRWMSLVGIVGLVACGAGKVDGEDADTAESAGGGAFDVDEEIEFDGDGPVVISGRMWCDSGGESAGMITFFEVRYADPQGNSDVEFGEVAVYATGSTTEVFRDEMLVCRSGTCEATYRDGVYDSSVTCSTVDRFDFFATVTDRSGLQSEAVTIEWED
ncbi:MAG TPA: hypothetical protein DFR83_14785 [Deltaproteobacteria bacterium]|nr:hypothetical protein [Deltaproteobacteria bacterium]